MRPSRSSSRSPRRAAALGPLLVAALVGGLVDGTPEASAAGFTTPRAISPVRAAAGEPQVAVAPSGRTAVVWQQFDRQVLHGRYVASIGAAPGRLGRAVPVAAIRRKVDDGEDPTLLALPGGGFALCFARTETRRRTSVGCTFASRSGGFGPFHVVSTRPSREVPALLAAPRPDGTLVVVTTRRVASARRALRSAILRPSGTVRGARALATIESRPYDVIDLATAADGTAAVSWTTLVGGVFSGHRAPVLRLMARGTDRFGPAVPFGAPATISSYVGVQGGRDLLVSYAGGVVRRRPDGTFEPPLELPRVGGEDADGSVAQLADGSLFGVGMAGRQGGDDCDALVRSAVGAGPLVPPGTRADAERLSVPRQIADGPLAETVRDGTVVAAWGDRAGDPSRVEVAIRGARATSFGSPRPLPALAARSFALATGGNEAVLAWLTGDRLMGPSHVVVSHLVRKGPYAPAAPRPATPSAPCS